LSRRQRRFAVSNLSAFVALQWAGTTKDHRVCRKVR
jgi:hypothetical protein